MNDKPKGGPPQRRGRDHGPPQELARSTTGGRSLTPEWHPVHVSGEFTRLERGAAESTGTIHSRNTASASELCEQGVAAILDGDREKAWVLFNAALEVDPNHRTARANLQRLTNLRSQGR